MKEDLTKLVDENVSWLENNQMASKEEYESRMKEFQEAMKPLQEKMMAGMQGMGGANGMPGGFPGGMPQDMPSTRPSDETTHGGPKIEEVD
jgi:L1 cell adhesion molecule like protein